jgi:hypothetical protein
MMMLSIKLLRIGLPFDIDFSALPANFMPEKRAHKGYNKYTGEEHHSGGIQQRGVQAVVPHTGENPEDLQHVEAVEDQPGCDSLQVRTQQ